MTSYLLHYQYTVGEKLRYQLTTAMHMADPELGELAGKIVHKIVYQALEEKDGGWILQYARRLSEESGPLTAHLPPNERQDRVIRFHIRPDGTTRDLGQGIAGRMPRFPAEAVSPGVTWQVNDPPLTLAYSALRFEPHGDDLLAQLALASHTQDQDVRGTAVFSVTRGHLVSSRTRIVMLAADGRRVETALALDPG